MIRSTGTLAVRALVILIAWSAWMSEEFAEVDLAQTALAGQFDRPAANPHQSRSVVIAKHGIVATSHPLAAEAGLDVLKKGGNAADAAITASAMLGLVEPMSCGIGGDVFVIYWDNKTKTLYGLNGSGRSPYSISRKTFRDKGLDEIPINGPLAWSVPGCVDGWDMLRKRFGTLDFHELLAQPIQTARDGFPVSEIIGRSWAASQAALANWPDSARTYLPGGQAPGVGQVFTNPDLAWSYSQIAEHGRDAFYKGQIAKRIVDFSNANNGFFSSKDFVDHHGDWIEPVSTNYRGYDVWELPPNGQGIAALEMLNVLKHHDIKSLGHNSSQHIHLFVEAKKLAFADRALFYADPDFGKLPTAELISDAYGKKQNARIDLDQAATNVPAGDPKLQHGDTVYLTVVDKDRNCCSFIQSNYHGFGSKVVPGQVGFCLQNRGQLFALDDTHLNRLEPHKRPFHTIIPAFVTKDGKPWLCFGLMGGDMQPQGHVQVLMNIIDFGMNVQQAGDAARIRHIGSATPTGQLANPQGGFVALETAISPGTIRELEQLGHRIVRSPGSFGGYQAIRIDHSNGVLHGATEPRKDGTAAGY